MPPAAATPASSPRANSAPAYPLSRLELRSQPVHLSVNRRQPDARPGHAHCIMATVPLHAQWKALTRDALERGQVSAANSAATAFFVLLAALPCTARSD